MAILAARDPPARSPSLSDVITCKPNAYWASAARTFIRTSSMYAFAFARVVTLNRYFATTSACSCGGVNSRSILCATLRKPGRLPSFGGSNGRATKAAS